MPTDAIGAEGTAKSVGVLGGESPVGVRKIQSGKKRMQREMQLLKLYFSSLFNLARHQIIPFAVQYALKFNVET